MSGISIDPIAGLRAFLEAIADGQISKDELAQALDSLVNTGPFDAFDDMAWDFVAAKLVEASEKLDTEDDGLDFDDLAALLKRSPEALRQAASNKRTKAAKAREKGNDKRADNLENRANELEDLADQRESAEE